MVQRLQHDLGITVSESTLCLALARLRLSRLKLTRIVAQKANPANMARYALFEQTQGTLNTDAVVWIDETGLCDLDADRTHGRCVAAAAQRVAPRRSADAHPVRCSGDTGGVVTEVGLTRKAQQPRPPGQLHRRAGHEGRAARHFQPAGAPAQQRSLRVPGVAALR